MPENAEAAEELQNKAFEASMRLRLYAGECANTQNSNALVAACFNEAPAICRRMRHAQ